MRAIVFFSLGATADNPPVIFMAPFSSRALPCGFRYSLKALADILGLNRPNAARAFREIARHANNRQHLRQFIDESIYF